MNPNIAEKKLEEAIEAALVSDGGGSTSSGDSVQLGEAKTPYGAMRAGGYQPRSHEEYQRRLCLISRDVLDFVMATQPKEWQKLSQHYGSAVKDRFLARLSGELAKRGTLDVLRNGIKDAGCKFSLCYFPPASSLNPDVQRQYEGNTFSVVRQLRYSEKSEDSLDLGLFLNGVPLFTAELKNPFNGQNVENAISQYKFDRDPKEPLFAFGRCLAHFAVDPDLVYVTTRLAGDKTRFLPFNKGKFGGAGNEPVPFGYSTGYLWEEVWARDSVLNLVQAFLHEFELEDDKGKKTGEKQLIFPRYHQLDAVRRMVTHARQNGTGQRYLVQHSAGSGKSNSIAWLAHQLSTLHDAANERVFDSIIVITDRRVLDRQLQQTVRQFQQVTGVVENIDKKSKQLKEALEQGKTIIVTTLQKFPVISKDIADLPGKRFAIIADEAHSSQGGQQAGKDLKAVFAPKDLEEAERDAGEEEDGEDYFVRQAQERQFHHLKNVSVFAFTATPKQKTLELFGTKQPDGTFKPFSLYSMRQAIEEGFILDVLENYTTYHAYWKLLKKAQDDPHYEKSKAAAALRRFVDETELVIEKKVAIMVDHFHEHVSHRIKGRAKAMIVTRSRLHAVRYKLVVDRYLRDQGLPYRALVAFSGTVRDPFDNAEYRESGMNGIPETQTRQAFEAADVRFLIVAEKFQTGFDQPLLHTMYVDKKLSGLNAVQTLSRLNRTLPPDKTETMVLDFVNEAEDIKEGFQPYFEGTILSEETDPNLLYDHQRKLLDFHIFSEPEVDSFAGMLRDGKPMDLLYAAVAPIVARFEETSPEEQADFRGTLNDYIRLYAFLSQVVTFADADLEKLYLFARLLHRRIPPRPDDLPKEVTSNIDLDSYRIQKTSTGKIELDRGTGELEPMTAGSHGLIQGEEEPLSAIIRELNDRFGTDFTEEDKVFIEKLEGRLGQDDSLRTAVRINPPENARLTFELKARERIQDLIDTDFDFYKRVTDDPGFRKYFLDVLFERFRREVE